MLNKGVLYKICSYLTIISCNCFNVISSIEGSISDLQEIQVFKDIKSTLIHNNDLKTQDRHLMIAVAGKECINEIETHLHFSVRLNFTDHNTGEPLIDLLRAEEDQEIFKAFGIDSECPPSVIHVPPHSSIGGDFSVFKHDVEAVVSGVDEFSTWYSDVLQFEVSVKNDLQFKVDLYWLNTDKNKQHYRRGINIGEVMLFNSYIGHNFIIRNSSRMNEHIASFSVKEPAIFIVSDLIDYAEKCNTLSEDMESQQCTIESTRALYHQRTSQKTKLEAKLIRERSQGDKKRLKINKKQPKLVPGFTLKGWSKGEVPKNLYRKLKDYWVRNEHKRVMESWGMTDTYVNWWESQPYLLPIPDNLDKEIFTTMSQVLQDWSGEKNLKESYCYGIRIYTNGAILKNHVDRISSHALSAIINVEQETNSDWPLELHGNDGTVERIVMKPGEMVLYESAKVIHGREVPLEGNFYANIFVHFQPTENWEFKDF